MKNHEFIHTSPESRRQKIDTVLRNRTNDSLSQEQLERVKYSLHSHCQYYVCVYTDPLRFCEALTLEHHQHQTDLGRILFGNALFGTRSNAVINPGQLIEERIPAAAVITRYVGASENPMHTIHIYVPTHIYMKGTQAKNEQRTQAQNCV